MGNVTTQLICHRGYHAEFPENTLDSFQAAIDVGAHGVETDLRLTRDDQLVFFHDRVLANGRPVNALSHKELIAAVGHDVPLAADALDAFPDLLWLLEIKSPEAAEPTLAALRSLARSPRVVVFSIWHNVVANLVGRCEFPMGLTFWHRPMSAAALDDSIGDQANRISTLVYNYEFLDPEMVAYAKAKTFDVAVFNPQNQHDHQQCLKLEVDLVITDFPDLFERAT